MHTTTTTTTTRRTTWSRRIIAGAVAATVAVGGLVAAADPASAAGPTAKLRMDPGSRACFTMAGYIPMSEYNSHGYVNNGAKMGVKVWGDDPVYDDLIWQVGPVSKATGTVAGARLWASSRGIEYEWYTCGTSLFWLNEDVPDDDEIYVHVGVWDGDNRLLGSVESNRVSGNFGFIG